MGGHDRPGAPPDPSARRPSWLEHTTSARRAQGRGLVYEKRSYGWIWAAAAGVMLMVFLTEEANSGGGVGRVQGEISSMDPFKMASLKSTPLAHKPSPMLSTVPAQPATAAAPQKPTANTSTAPAREPAQTPAPPPAAPEGVPPAPQAGGQDGGGETPAPLKPAHWTPVVSSVHVQPTGGVIKAGGGATIVVDGSGFGDSDCTVSVRLGDTAAQSTVWISEKQVLAKVAPGVGGYLDVAVMVSEEGRVPAVGLKYGTFGYSHPFIYDVYPLVVGRPVEGPSDITIKAWGVGLWDTHPEAQINGIACHRTRWVDNQTVVCGVAKNTRVSLENPELKVGGQRSTCHVMHQGVCTVSKNHGSINTPSHLEAEIRQLEAHGEDASWLKIQLKAMLDGGAYEKNSALTPCTTWDKCMPSTWGSAMSSALIMLVTFACFFYSLWVMSQAVWAFIKALLQHLKVIDKDPWEKEQDMSGYELIFPFFT